MRVQRYYFLLIYAIIRYVVFPCVMKFIIYWYVEFAKR